MGLEWEEGVGVLDRMAGRVGALVRIGYGQVVSGMDINLGFTTLLFSLLALVTHDLSAIYDIIGYVGRGDELATCNLGFTNHEEAVWGKGI